MLTTTAKTGFSLVMYGDIYIYIFRGMERNIETTSWAWCTCLVRRTKTVRFGFGYLKDGSVRFVRQVGLASSPAKAVLDGSRVCPVNPTAFSEKLYRDYIGVV